MWLSEAVQEDRRFALREWLRWPGAADYRLRDTGVTVPIRHSQADAFVLHEVFNVGTYDPPAAVAAALEGAPGGPRIVDLGANLGFFSLLMTTRYPAARVVALEPDPANARLLAKTLRRNGLTENVEVIEACAHTENGWVGFAGGLGCRSHMFVSDGDEPTVRAVDVFRYLGDVDLLKIDIEGAEWPLLADDRLAAAAPRAIVLEYHSWGCPTDNAKRAAGDRLAELGYRVDYPVDDPAPESGAFWGGGVLWATLPGDAGATPRPAADAVAGSPGSPA